jgi:hypothetical protein
VNKSIWYSSKLSTKNVALSIIEADTEGVCEEVVTSIYRDSLWLVKPEPESTEVVTWILNYICETADETSTSRVKQGLPQVAEGYVSLPDGASSTIEYDNTYWHFGMTAANAANV